MGGRKLLVYLVYVRTVVTAIFVMTVGGRLRRVKIVTPKGSPAPLDSPHFLLSFRVSTCAFASKTFARRLLYTEWDDNHVCIINQ